ncbi:conjugative transposon DNA recombination protein [Streptococcus equi subsp. zooepidemicus Sz16]|uniref:DNA primase n=1 Tax=Streptococcus equi TaxID=1336 RepID=UPI0005C2EE95|nr:DNA primase [Streptococcus equi]KIS07774.1 conjugative transposon DNA recombination protein [Streptococcus equi subsp. zooepidemicus Sz16]
MINKENYINNIPQELKERNQWLWFKIYHNEDKNGKMKKVKIPISPITCESKEWNKEENWASFETALDGLERSGCDGLSFVLTEDDPFICIDLDKVKDRFEDVQDIISDFGETYKEISVSGNGVHIFAKGKIHKNINNQIDHFEMYKSNKCIAMTGDVIGTCTEIQNEQYKLNLYYEKYALKETIIERISYYKNIDSDVPEIEGILKAIYMTNRKGRELFRGEYSTGDASKDDFQLLLILNSFTHGNADLMLEMFLKSALNRMGDMSKRRTEAAYIRYLNQSLQKAQEVGGTNYWDYNYHRKTREVVR